MALVRTLRNRSDRATKDKFKRLIPKNDHVKNKDRQDPSAVLTLSNSKLTDELRNTGYVCHTIIPELDKFSPGNEVGMHTSPISVAVPCYGWIAFVSYDVKTSTCTLFKARLHSPVDEIVAMRKNLKAKEIHSSDGIIFISAKIGPIKAVEFQEGSIFLISKKVKQKKKGDLVDLANKLQVQSTGTVAEITSQIQAYSNSLTKKYSQNNVKGDQIHFWDCEEQPSFEAVVCEDNELMCSKKPLMSFQVEKDGASLKGTNQQVIVQYSPGLRKINSVCLCGSSIFILQCQGVSKISLESGECRLLVELVDMPCVQTRFGSDVLFTNQKMSPVWHLKPCS